MGGKPVCVDVLGFLFCKFLHNVFRAGAGDVLFAGGRTNHMRDSGLGQKLGASWGCGSEDDGKVGKGQRCVLRCAIGRSIRFSCFTFDVSFFPFLFRFFLSYCIVFRVGIRIKYEDLYALWLHGLLSVYFNACVCCRIADLAL